MLNKIAQEIDFFIDHEFGMNVYYPLLYSLILATRSRRVFEFGLGMSSKVMLQALNITDGQLISCDIRGPKAALWGRGHQVFIPGELGKRWKVYPTSSDQCLASLKNERFDLVLHDGSHTLAQVDKDIRGIIDRLEPQGFLLIHDTSHPDYDMKEGVYIPRKHTKIEFTKFAGLQVIQVV